MGAMAAHTGQPWLVIVQWVRCWGEDSPHVQLSRENERVNPAEGELNITPSINSRWMRAWPGWAGQLQRQSRVCSEAVSLVGRPFALRNDAVCARSKMVVHTSWQRVLPDYSGRLDVLQREDFDPAQQPIRLSY